MITSFPVVTNGKRKKERGNKGARKKRRDNMEGTKETYRRRDVKNTLKTPLFTSKFFFAAEFFRGFFRRRNGGRKEGDREGVGKRERVKWRKDKKILRFGFSHAVSISHSLSNLQSFSQ